jgi:hypothetical protein
LLNGWRCCGNQTATTGLEADEERGERKNCERGTARKKLKSALAFLDLGQSFSGANRDGWLREQPPKSGVAVDANTAQRSLSEWCGVADAEATPNAGRERVETGNADNKKRAAFFQSCSFFWWQVVCGTEGGTTDWNSPAEQRERPKRDRFFASAVYLQIGSFLFLYLMYGFNKHYRFYCFPFWDLFVCKKRYVLIFPF